MADIKKTLGPFPKGLIRKANHLDFPDDALWDVENVDLSVGLTTRDGCSLVSDGSLPVGTVLAIKQGRYPTPEKSKIIAQVEYEPQWVEGTDISVRTDPTVAWDTSRGRLLVFGGCTDAIGGTYASDLWAYDPDTSVWTEITPTGTPPSARFGAGGFYDAANDRFYVILGSDGSPLTDTFYYNCTTNAWVEVSTTGTPPSYYRGAYKASTQEWFVYDTGYGGPTTYSKLTLSTGAWSQVAVTYSGVGTDYPDETNQTLRCVFDSESNSMVVFGGGHEVAALYPAILDLTTDAYSLGTAFPDADGRGAFGAICCSGNMVLVGGANFGGGDEGISGNLSIYDISGDAWTTALAVGALAERMNPGLAITDTSQLILVGGETLGTHITIGDVWVLDNNVCNGVAAGANDLYASSTLLPSTTATFTSIYQLGDGAGTVNITQLNDRVVITEGVNEPPLVFPGSMSTDASDWAVPKNVLARPNGTDAYDISQQVCDKDADTVADVGNWIATGDMLVSLDMPKTSGLYVQVGTANTGIPDSEQVFYEKVTFSEYSEINRHDVKATITSWVQSAGATGQFTDGANPVTIGPTYTNPHVVKGSQVIINGVTRYIMNITNGGAGAAEVTLDDTQTSDTVDYIYNTELHVAYTNLKGVITNYVQDAGSGGHFTNGVSTVSLGPGNNCPDVVAGLIVVIAGVEYTIEAIAGDGTAASAVTLSGAAASGTVSLIRTSTIVNSGITLSGSDGAWSALATKTLTLEQIADSSSVRQAVLGSELSGDGSICRFIWKAYSGTTVGTGGAYTNTGMKIIAASIVERSGSTWNGTTTPTPITFNSGEAGAQCAIGGEIVSDPIYYAVDNAKDYLVITDYGTAI